MPLKERYRYRWVRNSQFVRMKCEECRSTDDVVEEMAWFADEGNRDVTFHFCRQCIQDQLLPPDDGFSNSDRANMVALMDWLKSSPIEECLGLILHFEIPAAEKIA